MNQNLQSVLRFLSYVGIIGGVALVQYLKVIYPNYDGTLVLLALTSAGTGLGIFHAQGSSKSNSTEVPTGDSK